MIIPALYALISCISSRPLQLDETDQDYQLGDYYVDKFGNEGIVAYIFEYHDEKKPSNYSKSIMVVSLDETYESWGPLGERLYIADTLSNSLLLRDTYSLAMLQAMHAKGIERYPAQDWCYQKNKDGVIYSGSWRLPSLYEIHNLFVIKKRLNELLLSYGGTPWDEEEMYWTCVEDLKGSSKISDIVSNYDPEDRAIILNLRNETYSDKDTWLKKYKYHVRAIKYIYHRERKY